MKNDRRVRPQPINALLQRQCITLVGIVFIVLWWLGSSAAVASLFGGGIAVANTLLQRWHLIASVEQAKSDAGKNLRKAYSCVVQRWVLTIVMFAVGFAVLKFLPLPLMTGFIVTQLALLFGIKNQA
ncbi:MAG: ATP synthase subunit I [Gammaproteobacteria bacterium]|nr:ATP synthase subunit I [Gammaproteobacteria bacterium]